MKILAIDLTYGSIGGADTQIVQIIKHIDSYDFDRCLIYTNSNNLKLFKGLDTSGVSVICPSFVSGSLFMRILWQQTIFPFRLLFDKVSILYSPGNISPIFSFTKKVQWIGTIGPFEKDFYKYFSIKNRISLYINKVLMMYSSKTSLHVFFESKYTLNLFSEKYDFDKNKGTVLNIGRSKDFFPVDNFSENKILPFLEGKVILTVSHLYPYKNIETLIKAFFHYSKSDRESKLLIAGSAPFDNYYQHLNELVDRFNLSKRVVFLGSLNKVELRELYSLCTLFVFTSPFENYAYTLVEAMSCGAPILTTNSTAMPETCSDAALYFDPYSVSDLLSKMNYFMSDASLRGRYKKLSIRQSLTIDDFSEVNAKTNKALLNVLQDGFE